MHNYLNSHLYLDRWNDLFDFDSTQLRLQVPFALLFTEEEKNVQLNDYFYVIKYFELLCLLLLQVQLPNLWLYEN